MLSAILEALKNIDYILLLELSIFWVVIFILCIWIFDCPKSYLPNNNNGKTDPKYYMFYGNYVSIIHAFTSAILAGYNLKIQGITFGASSPPFEIFICHYTLSYFLVDSIQSEYFKNNRLPMTIHHAMSLSSLLYTLSMKSCTNEIMVALVIAEISNPFNLMREILKMKNLHHTNLYKIFGMIFAIIFFVARFVILPIYFYYYWPSSSDRLIKVLSTILWLISWYWMYAIFKGVYKTFFTKRKESKTIQVKDKTNQS